MSDSACGLVVMRYGEVFLKGDNRRRFERLLEHNAEAALRGLGPLDLERGQGRLFLRTRPDQAHAALARLRYVFGFSSVSRAVEIEANPATLESEAVTAVGQLLGSWRPRTFRVRARRSDKRFPVISPEIGRRIGHALGEHYGLQVDLERAECTIGVEIGSAASFIYIDRLDGPGGLPVGTSAHVALLLSGGIDSPVAGYLALKRGCSLRAIYFHSPPHTSPYALDKVERLATRLARWQQSIALHVVDFSDIQQRIRKRAESPLLVLLYRRAMMRIASGSPKTTAVQQSSPARASAKWRAKRSRTCMRSRRQRICPCCVPSSPSTKRRRSRSRGASVAMRPLSSHMSTAVPSLFPNTRNQGPAPAGGHSGGEAEVGKSDTESGRRGRKKSASRRFGIRLSSASVGL
jgi:tRNA sulfurtransferase ThiI